MGNEYFGEVRGGQFVPDNPCYYGALARFNGRRVLMKFGLPTKQRSLKENSYYWSVIIPALSELTGYTDDEMHEALKWKFLRENKEAGLETVKSTTALSTVEFEAYCEAIRRWASADMGCYLPLPNEPKVDKQ